MTSPSLTKQDLLQRLKEQEEAHKQRRLDILSRVKMLEARKKFVGELKAWMARRKLTNTDLLAMYRELQPRRADKPVRSTRPLQPGGNARQSAAEMFVAEMKRQRAVEVDSTSARDIVEKIGFSRSSYSHVLVQATRAGLLRRGTSRGHGANGLGFTYTLTGGGPKPKKTDAIVRKGDPEFRTAIKMARLDKKLDYEAVGKKIGVSSASVASWERGRYVPKEEYRQKILKLLDLPEHLGAEATKAMEAAFHRPRTNGATAE